MRVWLRAHEKFLVRPRRARCEGASIRERNVGFYYCLDRRWSQQLAAFFVRRYRLERGRWHDLRRHGSEMGATLVRPRQEWPRLAHGRCRRVAGDDDES